MARSISKELPSASISSVFRPARILIADDDAVARETLAHKLTSLGYACTCCENGPDALDRLANETFDLVLADLLMPGRGGLALPKEIKRICPEVAIILVTSLVDIEVAVDSLKDGAYDYITKPFSMEEMSIRVSRALEKRRLILENQSYQQILEEQVASRTHELREAMKVLEHTYHSTLVALSKAMDSRDADPDGHSLRVTMYTTRLARQLGIDEAELRVIEQGVLLHDIGKIGIPDALLRKSGKLTESEWYLMRQHPEIGYRILNRIKFLKRAAQIVLHHHERYDGGGYPSSLRGDDIILGARIFAVSDALESLTWDHPYQAAASFEAAGEEIAKMSGAQLDPMIVSEFMKIPVSEWDLIRQEVAMNAGCADFLMYRNNQLTPVCLESCELE
jgi:putative nucleotidyltransferase with HDIG domain